MNGDGRVSQLTSINKNILLKVSLSSSFFIYYDKPNKSKSVKMILNFVSICDAKKDKIDFRFKRSNWNFHT